MILLFLSIPSLLAYYFELQVNSNSGKNLVNRRNGSGGGSGGDDGSDESGVADSSSPSLTIGETLKK